MHIDGLVSCLEMLMSMNDIEEFRGLISNIKVEVKVMSVSSYP